MLPAGRRATGLTLQGFWSSFQLALRSPVLLSCQQEPSVASTSGLGRETQFTAELSRFLVYPDPCTCCPAFAGSVWSHCSLFYSGSEGVAVGGRAKSTAGNTVSLTGYKGHQPGMEICLRWGMSACLVSYTVTC